MKWILPSTYVKWIRHMCVEIWLSFPNFLQCNQTWFSLLTHPYLGKYKVICRLDISQSENYIFKKTVIIFNFEKLFIFCSIEIATWKANLSFSPCSSVDDTMRTKNKCSGCINLQNSQGNHDSTAIFNTNFGCFFQIEITVKVWINIYCQNLSVRLH